MIGSASKDSKVHKQLIKEARLLNQNWTKIIERRVELKEKGTLDVKVDTKTATLRQKAVNLMLEAVDGGLCSRKEKDTNLVDSSKQLESDINTDNLLVFELVEKYLFFSNNKRTTQTYRRSVRRLTFDLKSNKNSLREILLQKGTHKTCYQTVSKLIKDYLTESKH